MNKYVRSLIEIPAGIIKSRISSVKKDVSISFMCAIAPLAEITIDRGARCHIEKKFRARSGSHIRVRKGATINIGENTSVNHNCMIVCREKIDIGANVQLSPNVMIYDHDHDYMVKGGIKMMEFKTSPIIIGDNVWIGANTVILRGSIIGNNSIIAAGSVVKGVIPDNTLFIQKRLSDYLEL